MKKFLWYWCDQCFHCHWYNPFVVFSFDQKVVSYYERFPERWSLGWVLIEISSLIVHLQASAYVHDFLSSWLCAAMMLTPSFLQPCILSYFDQCNSAVITIQYTSSAVRLNGVAPLVTHPLQDSCTKWQNQPIFNRPLYTTMTSLLIMHYSIGSKRVNFCQSHSLLPYIVLSWRCFKDFFRNTRTQLIS